MLGDRTTFLTVRTFHPSIIYAHHSNTCTFKYMYIRRDNRHIITQGKISKCFACYHKQLVKHGITTSSFSQPSTYKPPHHRRTHPSERNPSFTRHKGSDPRAYRTASFTSHTPRFKLRVPEKPKAEITCNLRGIEGHIERECDTKGIIDKMDDWETRVLESRRKTTNHAHNL